MKQLRVRKMTQFQTDWVEGELPLMKVLIWKLKRTSLKIVMIKLKILSIILFRKLV